MGKGIREMNRKEVNRKMICFAVAGSLMAGAFAGCGKSSKESDGGAEAGTGGGKTAVSEIADKYREKQTQEDIIDGIFGSKEDFFVCEEEVCAESDGAQIANEVTAADDSLYSEPHYDTREYDSIKENGFVSTADRPLSTFAADRDTASYSNVRAYIEAGTLPPDGAVRIEEMLNYFTYDYKKKPVNGEKFAVYTEYSDCPWNKDTKLMMVGINTEDIDFEEKKPSNLVFLIDTSGSMYDDNKLPLVQQSFAMLAENLDEDDRVSIVTYAGEDTVVLSGTPGSEQYTISEALSGMTAEGCTNGGDAIITAYELAEKNFVEGGNNRVILATDGDLNVGLTSESDLVDLITEEKKDNNIFLSVLGFGTDNLKDNKLEALADNGDGSYAFIDSVYEAKKVLVDEMGGTLNTVAKDVKFQIEFNPANVKGYRQIGYENRALADEDFANDAVDGGEIGAGHMVTVLYEVVPMDSDYDVPSVDRKYSGDFTVMSCGTESSDELATINIRYKEPEEDKSRLESYVVDTDSYNKNMSADMSFAASVALYGMMLKNSDYTVSGDYELVNKLAHQAVEYMENSDGSSDENDLMKLETRKQFEEMVRETMELIN